MNTNDMIHKAYMLIQQHIKTEISRGTSMLHNMQVDVTIVTLRVLTATITSSSKGRCKVPWYTSPNSPEA